MVRDLKIKFGAKTYVMGILNVTPDSFSDGGSFNSVDAATRHAAEMLDAGADIIDIGAESTRPGFTPVDAATEISRLKNILPAVKKLGATISVDTYKPEVAEFALENGADIINDVRGRMFDVAEKFGAPIIAMHNEKIAADVVTDIKNFIHQNQREGLQIIFDVGIGFGKTQEENLRVLRNLREIKNLGVPVMLGVSRKSVIGYAAGFDVSERDEATGAICVLAIAQGVDIVRVHNVALIAKMCRMADILVRRNFHE